MYSGIYSILIYNCLHILESNLFSSDFVDQGSDKKFRLKYSFHMSRSIVNFYFGPYFERKGRGYGKERGIMVTLHAERDPF